MDSYRATKNIENIHILLLEMQNQQFIHYIA